MEEFLEAYFTKKIHDKKDNNFGYVKSIDPNIEIDEGVLVKDSLLSEISFDVRAYAEVINPELNFCCVYR